MIKKLKNKIVIIELIFAIATAVALMNTEGSTVKFVDINGYEAFYYIAHETVHCLTWDNGDYLFEFDFAGIDYETGIKIAESIRKV
ncbi:MAG: DUF4367 domain-containing protein [Ruminiclostridium sp.]|nr:DUF4367 domain-containing protein [Ruminiclostridium sp.]